MLGSLDRFEGRSRFSTWVFKFGILHAGTEARRALWRDRPVDLTEHPEPVTGDHDGSASVVEAADLAAAVSTAIDTVLTARQRRCDRPHRRRGADRRPGRADGDQPQRPLQRRCTTSGWLRSEMRVRATSTTSTGGDRDGTDRRHEDHPDPGREPHGAQQEPGCPCDDCFEQIDLYVDSLVHDHPTWTNRCGCTWPPPAWRPSR